jgi:pantetheine-phosphate adenylyltransferase
VSTQTIPVTGIYPGSFDPPTLGHIDIAIRAARLVENLTIAVYGNPAKSVLFTPEERVILWKESLIATEAPSNITVQQYTGLTTTFAHSIGATLLFRGLRTISDFEAEFQQTHMYRRLSPDIEVVMLVTDLPYMFISASLVKEVARLGAPINSFVTDPVAKALENRLNR